MITLKELKEKFDPLAVSLTMMGHQYQEHLFTHESGYLEFQAIIDIGTVFNDFYFLIDSNERVRRIEAISFNSKYLSPEPTDEDAYPKMEIVDKLLSSVIVKM